MRETGGFFLYLFACLLLATIVTYPLMQTGWIESDPQRVMGRVAQVFVLLGLWPFLKAMGLNHRNALGYGAERPRLLSALWRGWLLGLAILLVLVFCLLLLEIRSAACSQACWRRPSSAVRFSRPSGATAAPCQRSSGPLSCLRCFTS